MKTYLGSFHFSLFLMASISFLQKMPATDAQTDACTYAAGAYFYGDSPYHPFVMDKPGIQGLGINDKEVMAIVLAAKRWSHLWKNKHSVIQSKK